MSNYFAPPRSPAFTQWGLVNVFISTWERRYDLTSANAAWVISSQDLVAAVISPIFGYLSGFLHMGKVLTWGAICMAVGSFLMCVPQFGAPPYELGPMLEDDRSCGGYSELQRKSLTST